MSNSSFLLPEDFFLLESNIYAYFALMIIPLFSLLVLKPQALARIIHNNYMLRNGALYVANRKKGGIIKLEDSLADLVWVIDFKGTYTYVSPSVQHLCGYSTDEFLARNVRDTMTTVSYEHLSVLQHAYKESPRGDGANRIELELYHKQGGTVWVECVLTPAITEDGTLAGYVGVNRDISMRTALQRHDDLSQLAIDYATESVFWLEITGNIIQVNNAACDMLGYTRDELLQFSIGDLDNSFTFEHWKAEVKNIQQTGSWHMVSYFRTKEGWQLPVEIKAYYIHYHGVEYVLTYVQNVIDRKNSQTTLYNTLEQLSSLNEEQGFLLENISDIIYSNDVDGNITYVSPAVERIIGCAASEWREHFHDFLTDNSVNRKALKYSELARKTGIKMPPYLLEVSYKGQEPVMLEINEKPIMKRDMVTGVIGTARDVTRKIAAEQALKESENLFSVFMDHLPAGVFIKDEQTNIQYVNKFMKEIFGATDWVGRSVHADLSDEQIQAVSDYDWKLLQHGPLIYEDQFLGKDKKNHYYQTYQFPIKKGDKERLVGSIAYDITQQKELELQLQQAQKMESIGRLAGGIAHDFNNLLTAISGHADLLLLSMDEDDPRLDDAKEIIQTAHRAARLARQLLAFSRQQATEPRVLDLNQVIEELKRMLVCIIGEDISIKSELASELKRIKIDPLQVEQIIMNLAVNARDAMPKGGELVLMTRNELPKLSLLNRKTADTYVALSITDTGEGMSEEVKSHMFEPFFTTKPQEQGTGLGLAIVYGIVAQNGGYIDVESTQGVGTTFTIYLPAHDAEEPVMDHVDHERKNSAGNEHILVVEDEGLVRKALVRSLMGCGYTVIDAPNAEQALAICEGLSRPIDLILTDLIMPHMRGDELACRIRDKWPEVKILLMSGYMRNLEEQDCIMNFIQKPFKPQVLQEKIRNILDDKPEQ